MTPLISPPHQITCILILFEFFVFFPSGKNLNFQTGSLYIHSNKPMTMRVLDIQNPYEHTKQVKEVFKSHNTLVLF